MLTLTVIASAQVKFYGGGADSVISSGVVIPAGYGTVWMSGAVLEAGAPAGSRKRFGDTRAQAAES